MVMMWVWLVCAKLVAVVITRNGKGVWDLSQE